jgi:DNA polymerase III epsilon subunit-like protein
MSMLPTRYCVLDTETTGLEEHDQVIEIASVRFINGDVDLRSKFRRLVCQAHLGYGGGRR